MSACLITSLSCPSKQVQTFLFIDDKGARGFIHDLGHQLIEPEKNTEEKSDSGTGCSESNATFLTVVDFW